VPCHLTKEKKEHHINLLLIQPEETYIDIKKPIIIYSPFLTTTSGLKIFPGLSVNKTLSTMVGCCIANGVFKATTPSKNLRLMKWIVPKSTSAV